MKCKSKRISSAEIGDYRKVFSIFGIKEKAMYGKGDKEYKRL